MQLLTRPHRRPERREAPSAASAPSPLLPASAQLALGTYMFIFILPWLRGLTSYCRRCNTFPRPLTLLKSEVLESRRRQGWSLLEAPGQKVSCLFQLPEAPASLGLWPLLHLQSLRNSSVQPLPLTSAPIATPPSDPLERTHVITPGSLDNPGYLPASRSLTWSHLRRLLCPVRECTPRFCRLARGHPWGHYSADHTNCVTLNSIFNLCILSHPF